METKESNIPQFKIRASAGSHIMGVKALGLTGLHYCEHWIKEQLFNRRKEFSNKYTEKGNIVEQDNLDFVADQLDLGMLIKNEKHFENDWFTGTPDAITKDCIIDVKSSWDPFTFPLFADSVPNKGYVFQAQIYMHLTGKRKYKLIYGLLDTPQHIIIREASYKSKRDGYEELTETMLNEFMKDMTYDDIDPKYRIKVFDIEYDQAIIDQLCIRVVECRSYIDKLRSIEF